MNAMTMPFALLDTNLVSGIAPGDSIGFTIQLSQGEPVVTGVTFLSLAPPEVD